MSLLTSALPDCITAGGERCRIRTDFRVWLSFSELVKKDLSPEELLTETVILLFPEVPKSADGLLAAVSEFYAAGRAADSGGEKTSVADECFDFEHDAPYIYAAFLQQYGIDLTSADMHWHKFRALLAGLSEDTQFMKIIGYRSMDTRRIKDREQKAAYEKIKKAYALPKSKEETEKIKKLTETLLAGGDISGII